MRKIKTKFANLNCAVRAFFASFHSQNDSANKLRACKLIWKASKTKNN